MVTEPSHLNKQTSKTLPKRNFEKVCYEAAMRTYKGVSFFTVFLPVGPLGDFTWDEVGLETEDTEIMVKMVPRKVQYY